MSRYEHLPIFKAVYDLFIESLQITKTFPRDYRYTLGANFHTCAIEMLKLVYKANDSKNKIDTIKELLNASRELGILIRAAHDLKIMGDNRFFLLIEKRNNVEKQAAGWLKSFENNAGISLSE